MKIKPFIIALGSIALVGISCTSAFFSFAQTDDENTGSVTEASVSDYEEALAPYRKVLDDFNSTHGTTYSFMTDEQLARHNMNREEYLKETADIYSGMTLEEFENILETAYRNDMGLSAEPLPYYHEEENEGERVTVSVPVEGELVCPLDND